MHHKGDFDYCPVLLVQFKIQRYFYDVNNDGGCLRKNVLVYNIKRQHQNLALPL